MKQLQLPVDASATERMAAFIEEALDAAQVSVRDATKIKIVADEVLVNIVTYSGAQTMSVAFEVSEGEIHLQFRDDGCPYDPTKQPEPDVTLSAEERQIGGLGIFMVKKLMDRVAYARQDNENVLDVYKQSQA